MNRRVVVLLASALVVLAGCGGKAEDQGASTSASPAPAAPAPAASKVLAKSLYDDGPRAADSPVDAAAAAAGEKLFTKKGCTACHGWGKKLTGPDLKDVTRQRTAVWMEHQILHPDVMVKTDPIADSLFKVYKLQMTNQGLTESEAKQVVEYLKKRDKDGK
ncbi:MAG: cytochrome c [Candidatus Eisenbacteria bacterium]|nr:cytochrome c [Candidatus Eisenbacteria bacterium]